MTEKAAKAERSLANTCAKLGITEVGKRWLDLCLDPFKDLNMPTAGYPDSVTMPSVVQTLHDSYTISAPSSVTAGNNWDLNIFVDQLYNNVALYQTSYDASQQTVYQGTQGTTPYGRGGLVMRSGPVGGQLGIQTTTFGASLKQDILGEGDVRLIGIGLEIHNTTQELKKQGSLICYRIPDAPVSNLVLNQLIDLGVTPCIPLAQHAVSLIEVPTTATQAIDMPGSVQWEAKDGAYIVPILSAPTNPPDTPEVLAPIELDELTGQNYYPKMSTIGAGRMVYLPNPTANMVHGFSPSGCFMSGLSYETTLTVNLTYYVEVFPKKGSVLRRSVQPAPGLDAKALDLYAHIIAHMPLGVPVNDNFLGAFISGIAAIARTVGGFLVSNGPTIARGISAVSQVAGALVPSRPIVNRQVEEIEEVNSPAIRREMAVSSPLPRLVQGAGAIIRDIITNRGTEVVEQQNRRGITRTEFIPMTRPNARVNSGGSAVRRTAAAKQRKNQMIDNATKGYAGNRWIDNPKKK